MEREGSAAGRLCVRLATGVIFACLYIGSAHAQFVMGASPGPLSNAHKALECTQCHSSRTEEPAVKCLACHEPIAQRMKDKHGPHGVKKAAERECKLCHGEHRGLKADILGFATFGGKKDFDHRITGFPLTNKHVGVECEKCHTQKNSVGTTTFLKTTSACRDCHKSPHGDMPKPLTRCERCHDDRSWKPLSVMVFDHQRDTRYALVGKHVGVKCESCHAKALYHLGGSLDCARCHKNVHGDSLFGQKRCELCHSNAIAPWKDTSFDHDRRTHFLLRGPHDVACIKCHTATARTKPALGCASTAACHTDVHNGRFNKAPLVCTSCHPAHPVTTWKEIRFDHTQFTKFPLTGKHTLATCRDCHRGKTPAEFEHLDAVVTPAGVSCKSCHRHVDAHKGDPRAGQKCTTCHTVAGVIASNSNAISATGHGVGKSFQLTGPHNISCGKCHRGGLFTGLTKSCAGSTCHKDVHKDALGKDCLRCHEGVTWKAVVFDHQKSSYPLTGKHRDVGCDSCHIGVDQAVKWKPVPKSCGATACHGNAKDDVHKGSVGAECQRCHTDTSWKALRFDHKKWPLDGKHQQVKCAACHLNAPLYKPPAPTDCAAAGCHQGKDPHKGDFGQRCERCHNAVDWKQTHTGHADAVPDAFGGAHNRLPCVTCHSGGRVLRGQATMCISCHQHDDIHHNSLGPRCSECHTQQSFSGARFSHDTVGCTLRGIHRVLPCVDCHKAGNYSGLSPTCISCHRDDALRAPANRIVHITTMECTGCHTVNSFRQQNAVTSPPESVCQ